MLVLFFKAEQEESYRKTSFHHPNAVKCLLFQLQDCKTQDNVKGR